MTERPGTGINTLSAYLIYGLDHKGQSRCGAAAGFDHSWTTAVCGIHRRGKSPERAVEEIARLVDRMFAEVFKSRSSIQAVKYSDIFQDRNITFDAADVRAIQRRNGLRAIPCHADLSPSAHNRAHGKVPVHPAKGTVR